VTATQTPPAAPESSGRRSGARASLPDRIGGRVAGGGAAQVVALTAAAVGTTWVAMLAWRGFTTQAALFMGPLFLLALVVGGLGIALRLARLPVVAVLLAQVVAGFLAAQALVTGRALPSPTSIDDLQVRFSAGIETAQAFQAPVPVSAPGVEPLLIFGGLACLLLVDLLACSLRRVSLAGLPLLTIYTVPVSVTGSGVSWWVFVATASGFAIMLYLQESEHLSRWGRTLGQDSTSADPSAFGVRTGDVRGSAAGIAALSTVVALLLPIVIPTLSVSLFSGGFGSGTGDDLEITNPVTDLRRDLDRGPDTPLLTVTTADRDPSYLRIAVLTRLNDDSWSAGNRQVPEENIGNGDLPALTGVSTALMERSTGQQFSYQVQVTDALKSRWLPTAQNLTRIFPNGDFRYDIDTMDFLAGDDDTAGKSYSFTKIRLDYDAEELLNAPETTTAVSSEFTTVPPNTPERVREIARQVTEGIGNDYQRAVVLQKWFREDGGFTYSLDTGGSGTDDLLNFLEEGPDGRTGYCEQFASAMAIMARTLGIPARVAVGFLKPTEVGENRWQYSAHDMHAWPELFFPGSGWVRFEPTPRAGPVDAQINTEPPAYTQVDIEDLPEPTVAPSSGQESDILPDRGDERPSADPGAEDTAGDGGGAVSPAVRWALLAAAGLVVLGGLAYIPQLVRRARRERRWRVGGAQAAWGELRDTALDLGIVWRAGLSPRAMGDRLVAHFGADPVAGVPDRPQRGPDANPRAVEALDRVVHEVELLRYSRSPQTPETRGLRFDTEACATALAGGATAPTRRRARWWPRSLFQRQVRGRRSAARDTGPTVDAGVVVDHVG
jgi:transglutaminase-like putative cysteine protease